MTRNKIIVQTYWAIAVVVLTVFTPFSARALCIYHDKLYAKTSFDEEFKDSATVIKARALSSRDIKINERDEDIAVIYQLEVLRTYKGRSKTNLVYYSRRDSGSFYLDIGKNYLLFLDPVKTTEWTNDAPGALVVNYNCGQSRKWSSVPENIKRKLSALAKSPS